MILPTTFSMNINMNTPSSTINRATDITFEYDMNEKTFDFGLRRAEDEISMNGKFCKSYLSS